MPGSNETADIVRDIGVQYDEIIHNPASTQQDQNNAMQSWGEVMLDIIKAGNPD